MPRHEDYDWFMDTGGPKMDPQASPKQIDIALPISFEPAGDGMAACIHDANGAIVCEAKYDDFEQDVTYPERVMKLLVGSLSANAELRKALRRIADGWENLPADRRYEHCRSIARAALKQAIAA